MKKRGTLPCQWQDGGHGSSYTCLIVEDPSNKVRYVMHRFDVANWTEETVSNVTKYYSSLVERNSSSPVWSSALRVLNSARQSHYFNVVGEFSRLGSFSVFLSSCISDGSRPRRVGSVAAGCSRWMKKLSTSLAAMHELGVVHGDVRFTSLFLKNSDATVVSGEDPDVGDLDALLLGTPMPFAHSYLNANSSSRTRKPATAPPPIMASSALDQEPPSSPEGYNVIPPVHASILPLMTLFVNPPELSANEGSANQQQVKSDSACDVYQFGCLIASLIVSFRIFLHGAKLSEQQMKGAGGSSSSNSVETFFNLIHSFSPRLKKLLSFMTHRDRQSRPSMQGVLKELSSIDFNDVFAEVPIPVSLSSKQQPLLGSPSKKGNPSSNNASPNNINNSNIVNTMNTNNNSNKNTAFDHPSLQPESIEATRIDSNNNTMMTNQSGNSSTSSPRNPANIPSATAKRDTPNSKNRRSIAEARLKQRQKNQQNNNNSNNDDSSNNGDNNSFSDDGHAQKLVGKNNTDNINGSNSHQHISSSNNIGAEEDSWFQDAEKRLQQLEEMKQEQDQNSPRFQQKMMRENQVNNNAKNNNTNHYHTDPVDHLNETPPTGGPSSAIHSPPPQQQQQKSSPGSQQRRPKKPASPTPASSPFNCKKQESPARASVSPDPQKPAGYAGKSPIHQHHIHYHQQQQQQRTNAINNNHRKENMVGRVGGGAGVANTNINNNNNAVAGGGGGAGTNLHELRNMRKHERNALLEKQEREQEGRREQFLQMRAEKERKQEAEKKAFLERQRAHAAHLKQIKQAKRGIKEAVRMQQQHHQGSGGGDNNGNVNHNNNGADDAATSLEDTHQSVEDVQIFVKQSGQVMRCDDATGFVPMTEEEKNNSPILKNRAAAAAAASKQPSALNMNELASGGDDSSSNLNSSSAVNNNKHRQFHPQIHQHFELDDDGNMKSDGSLVNSVRMQMDASRTSGSDLLGSSSSNNHTAEGNHQNNSNALASPSALSTVQMSQQPGTAGRIRGDEPSTKEESPAPAPPVNAQQLSPSELNVISSLQSLLGEEAMTPLLAEIEVFSKAPDHVRCHPRANAVFATRVRNIVESAAMPKLTNVFGVSTEEEGFMALLVMLGQVLTVRGPVAVANNEGSNIKQQRPIVVEDETDLL